MGRGELPIHDNDKWIHRAGPRSAVGAGFHEAPRGSLGHWVEIEHGRIAQLSVRRAEHLERGTA